MSTKKRARLLKIKKIVGLLKVLAMIVALTDCWEQYLFLRLHPVNQTNEKSIDSLEGKDGDPSATN